MNAIARELEAALKDTRHVEIWNCGLPCNEHMFQMLAKVQAAVLVLDELFCVVKRIELGESEPTIHLQQAPRCGAVGHICELVRIEAGQRVTFKRARFMGCTLEWLTL